MSPLEAGGCLMAGIKIKIDPVDKILLKRNLNQNGQAQKFFSSEVRRMSDPYVPFQKALYPYMSHTW